MESGVRPTIAFAYRDAAAKLGPAGARIEPPASAPRTPPAA